MHRTVRTIAAAALATVLLGVGSANAANGPMPLFLKQRAVVGGEGVLLSDLFANVPADRDGRIADSPAPGDRLVIGARQLLHYARAFGLPWQPRDAKVYAEVVRDSMPVPADLVREMLALEIERQGAGDDFEVEVFNRDLPLFVATGTQPTLVVRNLVYDSRTNRFDAVVALVGSNAAPAIVNGKVEPMVSVPVLRAHAMPGDVIGEQDIEWVRTASRRAGANTVTRIDDLVGRTPRRPIAAGQPVRLTDVRPNFVVQKGDLVTILLKSGSMTLTVQAQALEKGAVGDVIRVRNNHSRRVLETRVIAADTVTVDGPQLASLN